jgi:hypothetical protein
MGRGSWFGRAGRAVIVVFGGAGFALGISATPACGSDDACGCDDMRTYPGASFATAHRPLECLCPSAGSDCRQNEANYEASLCGAVDAGITPGAVARRTGCGKITLGPDTAYAGRLLTFDSKTGALVGIEDFSDSNSGACNTFHYAYGTTLEDCDKIDRCILCGAGAARTCP